MRDVLRALSARTEKMHAVVVSRHRAEQANPGDSVGLRIKVLNK